MDRSDVFMSYRRTDVEFVKHLDSAFRREGKEVWVDWEDIPPGATEFTEEIRRGIEGADAFVAVLSPDYLGSTYCVDLELGYAAKLNKRIIPVVLHKLDGHDIPQAISHMNWIYFTPHAGQENPFDLAFSNVMEALAADFDYVRDHTRLLTRAQRWVEHSRHHNYLLNSGEVIQAEAWLAKGVRLNPSPTELHSEYILASRESVSRGQRRVRTIGAVVIALMAVMLVVAIFLGFEARNQRETAEQNYQLALTAEAEAVTQRNEAWNTRALFLADSSEDQLLAGSPQDALVLALESLHHFPDGIYNYESQLALLDALANKLQEERFIAQEENLHETGHLFLSADGLRALSWERQTATIYSLYEAESESVVFEHNSRIDGGIWSPDETQILTWINTANACRSDCIHGVNIWDVDNPAEPVVTISHEDRVEGALWNYDGGQVLSWSNTGGRCDDDCNFKAMLWDVNAPDAPLVSLDHPGKIRGASLSPDTSLIITWTEENIEAFEGTYTVSSVYIWDPNTPNEPIWSYTDTEGGYGIFDGASMNSDQSYLLAWSVGGYGLVWNLDDLGDNSPQVLQHSTGVFGAEWAYDDTVIITWQDQFMTEVEDQLTLVGGTIDFWDIDSLDAPYLSLVHDSAIYGVSLAFDGELVLSWGEDGNVNVWSLDETFDNSVPILTLAHRGEVYDALISSDGEHILTRTGDGIHLWELNNEVIPFNFLPSQLGLPSPDGTLMLMIPPPPEELYLPSLIIDVAGSTDDTLIVGDGQTYAYDGTWSPDGTRIALAQYLDAYIDIYSLDDLQTPLKSLPGDNVLWKGDGSHILTWFDYGSVYLWDAESLDDPLHEFYGGDESDVWVTMSENGQRFFIADYSASYYALYDVNDPERPVFERADQPSVTPILSDDGQKMALIEGRGVLVWDFNISMQPLELLSFPDRVQFGSFNSLGTHLALMTADLRGINHKLFLYSMDDLSNSQLDRDIQDFEWHPDGERLLILPPNMDLELWDISDFSGPQLELATGDSRSVYWDQGSEGGIFVTQIGDSGVNQDGVAYYWLLDQPDAPQFAIPNVGLMNGAIRTPDGLHVLTWSAIIPAKWWPMDLELLISVGQQRVLRTFTEDQGEEFNVNSQDLAVQQLPPDGAATYDLEQEFGSVETDLGIMLPNQESLPGVPPPPNLSGESGMPDLPDAPNLPGRPGGSEAPAPTRPPRPDNNG